VSDGRISIPNVGRDLNGIDHLGFFSAEHGVGEAARQLVGTMRASGVDVSTINYTDTESRLGHPFVCENESRHKVLLTSINADQMLAAQHIMGADFFRDRYVIGQWFWELESAPDWYPPAYPFVNELWAPTRFIESMLRCSVPEHVTVTYTPLPVVAPVIDASLNRAHYGLDNRFVFLFAFDFMSVMKRKNPLGLIEAFRRAFAPGEGPTLVIKAINGDKRPHDRGMLQEAAAQHDDVVILDEYLTRVETSTLASLADCYVSLHRSEGLGLTISEAIALGVPVIATGYSGNLDFMTDANANIVPMHRVKVGDDAGGYSPIAVWAEPNLDEAAALMRRVYENPGFAKEKARKARSEILNAFTAERSGAIMKNRLEQIWRSQRGAQLLAESGRA
jgi:glycosyltransferase involved in cell wall biosynthesis